MKKFLLLLVMATTFCHVFAQKESFKKRKAIGISFIMNDFQTAADIRNQGLSRTIRDHKFFKRERTIPGLALSYYKGITNHMDFVGSLAGTFGDYPIPNMPALDNDPFALEGTATVNFKLLSDKFWINPYVNTGVGASSVSGYFGAFIPAGLGVQVSLFDEVFLFVSSSYRVPVTSNVAYHFQNSIGLAGNIGKPRTTYVAPVVQLPVVETPPDRDNDGIVDANDECPDVAGPAALRGCPDRDGDGIADKNDNCPDVAGIAKYQGCPIPDTDKDGINDEEDRCINVPGVARYNGCPIPDGDGDGVNDEEDKCPTIAGPRDNNGCPVIEQAIIQRVNIAAKNIFFATGSAKLLAKSFPKLDDVVKIMQDDKLLKLDIEGHTDITGTAEKNQILSENRANSVKAYLESKGIESDRLNATGYGPDKPIADNKTAAGKAKNRRVEMKLRNY